MEAIFHSFIRAFGWSIVHSIWQGAIIYALLFLILVSIPKLSAVAKHNLSYLSICAIFTWFVATFISLWQIPLQASGLSYIPLESEYALFTSNGWSFANIEMLFPVIISIYVGGLLVQSFILFKGYRVLQHLRKTNLEEIPEDWVQIFYKVIAKLNINKAIDFHISQIASVPMVIGYFKPVILFPASLITSLDTEQVEAILIHELTHIRRNDYLLNLIKTFIDTVLFFNPFVWLTGRFIRIEREHVCDDMVLKNTGQPIKYAETLLQIELDKSRQIPRAAMAAASKKQYLLDRIKRMTNMKTNYMNVKQQLAGVTIVIAAVFCLAWLAPSKTLEVKKENKNLELSEKPSSVVNPKIAASYDHGIDTIIPKKKSDVKIIVTNPDGQTKEYNSIKALPDSLKADMGMFPGRNFSFIADSLILHSKDLGKGFSGMFTDTAFLRGQREIAEQFNSPEFKLNMKKAFESFNSPEFKKEMGELKKQFNSGEFKKQQDELMKNLNSAEFKKNQAELMATLNSKEFIGNQLKFRSRSPEQILKGDNSTIQMEGKNLFLTADSIYLSDDNKKSYRLFFNSREDINREKQLQKNKQYQKLKKKFDRDVEKLRKKQEQTESNK